MKQIIQSLKSGEIEVVDIPSPQKKSGNLLIKTEVSLISTGTERMLIDFGKANFFNKARQQPDKVKMVLDKVKTDGFYTTLNSVLNKLDEPLSMGYCNSGYVIDLDDNIKNFKIGDKVISNGKHAEIVNSPLNLCAKIPLNLSFEEASFTVIGAIALQGVRLLNPTLGECFAVFGLGLIGQITVQLLIANGCKVLAFDYDEKKLNLARSYGAEAFNLTENPDPASLAILFSDGKGIDGAIIATATDSNNPIHFSAQMCRKRGRIVLVGVAGLDISRADFFEKELTFQVSCSYGPGRYDVNYEEKNQDYPFGFVRWTEQRNFEAFLSLLASGSINVKPLISYKFNIEDAIEAYDKALNDKNSLAALLIYPNTQKNIVSKKTVRNISSGDSFNKSMHNTSLSFIGAGAYASSTLIKSFKKTKTRLNSTVTASGLTGFLTMRKFGFDKTTTDIKSILNDKEINAVVICTRHNSHATFVLNALKAGKNVFVEKPLCLTLEELDKIRNFYRNYKGKNNPPILTVGFNRRFSPHVLKIKSLLNSELGPKSIVMTINSGFIPPDHWTQDLNVGGGRIIGEACHFIDLFINLIGSSIANYHISKMRSVSNDTVMITLDFADGSIGVINYLSNGNKSFSKERLEIFVNGKILLLDNFKKLKGIGWPNFKSLNLWSQNKGQDKCAEKFVDSIANKLSFPIPLEEIFEVAEISIKISNL